MDFTTNTGDTRRSAEGPNHIHKSDAVIRTGVVLLVDDYGDGDVERRDELGGVSSSTSIPLRLHYINVPSSPLLRIDVRLSFML